jgi:hypothetical protein
MTQISDRGQPYHPAAIGHGAEDITDILQSVSYDAAFEKANLTSKFKPGAIKFSLENRRGDKDASVRDALLSSSKTKAAEVDKINRALKPLLGDLTLTDVSLNKDHSLHDLVFKRQNGGIGHQTITVNADKGLITDESNSPYLLTEKQSDDPSRRPFSITPVGATKDLHYTRVHDSNKPATISLDGQGRVISLIDASKENPYGVTSIKYAGSKISSMTMEDGTEFTADPKNLNAGLQVLRRDGQALRIKNFSMDQHGFSYQVASNNVVADWNYSSGTVTVRLPGFKPDEYDSTIDSEKMSSAEYDLGRKYAPQAPPAKDHSISRGQY